MERGFYNEDIEELLKQKADQYRMYPSDKVWKNVQRSLHPSRKWYWFGFVLFLSAIGYYTFVELFAPSVNKPVSEASSPSSTQTPETNSEATTANTKAVIIPFGNSNKQSSHAGSNTKHTSFVLNPDNTGALAANDQATVTAGDHTLAFNSEAPVYDLTTRRIIHDIQALSSNSLNIISDDEATTVNGAGTMETNAPLAVAPADTKKLNDKTAEEQDGQRINWLHELAVYELQQRQPKRVSWQLAFTPTMNYRRLTSHSNVTTPAKDKDLPLALQIGDNPEELVNHKPALGFEVGSHIMYAANKIFTFRAGLQFNYSRYDIQAYSGNKTEQAFIALNSSTGIGPNITTSSTNLRNMGGKIGGEESEIVNLRNQYFMLSMPVGLEANLIGNGKLQVGVAATLQPTYLLNRNSTYLISTDYVNYTKEPSLLRSVNLHTSAEAFVAYKIGDLKWQVGPQFRYQLLSTYVSEYPIRERLMEFGIKIGVAKTIR